MRGINENYFRKKRWLISDSYSDQLQVSQYTPICTEKMDEKVLADLENVKAEKLG